MWHDGVSWVAMVYSGMQPMLGFLQGGIYPTWLCWLEKYGQHVCWSPCFQTNPYLTLGERGSLSTNMFLPPPARWGSLDSRFYQSYFLLPFLPSFPSFLSFLPLLPSFPSFLSFLPPFLPSFLLPSLRAPELSGHCRTSARRQTECHIECQKECQRECQNRCQKECQNECLKRCQKVCQNRCQIECQSIWQKECQTECENQHARYTSRWYVRNYVRIAFQGGDHWK